MTSDISYAVLAGYRLKELRRNAGYTAEEFAKLSGCKSKQQVYRYERGINKIDIDTLVAALKVLSVDVSQFMGNLVEELKDEKVPQDVMTQIKE